MSNPLEFDIAETVYALYAVIDSIAERRRAQKESSDPEIYKGSIHSLACVARKLNATLPTPRHDLDEIIARVMA